MKQELLIKLADIETVYDETKLHNTELIVKLQNKVAKYSLQNNRKFDFNHLKALKAKKYVAKITV